MRLLEKDRYTMLLFFTSPFQLLISLKVLFEILISAFLNTWLLLEFELIASLLREDAGLRLLREGFPSFLSLLLVFGALIGIDKASTA